MIKRIELLKQYKGGDGRYRPGLAFGALDTSRVTYLERTDEWQGKKITTVHLDDGTMLDVLMDLDDVIAMLNEANKEP